MSKVWLTQYQISNTIWQGVLSPPPPKVVPLEDGLGLLDFSIPGWNGATLLAGEAILRFDFKGKVANVGYTIRVHFTDGTWLDINVPDETNNFRKLSVETKTSTYSNLEMSIYPNPAQTSFNVKLEGYNSEYADIVIYDMSGRQIMNIKKQFVPNRDLTIDLPSSINEGMYFVRLKNNKTVKSVPIIISK